MDIFNRAPTISEDTLHYTLYPPQNLSDKASVSTFVTCIQAYLEELLPGFIWHRDSFELKVTEDPDENDHFTLQGRMRVGDSVDDEWYVVWLMREISSKWDLAIKISDSDGEFLLIEAADILPLWVKPSNSDNRVWIYSSRLHLVPIQLVSPPSQKPKQKYKAEDDENIVSELSEEMEDWISAHDAVKYIRDPNVETISPSDVERIVWKRISTYPGAARKHIHVAKAYLPVDVARALSQEPPLVQKAVETFYTRDTTQLRAAHRMARFSPVPSVLTTVKMTRPAYAQLVGQKFHPPKIFGRWTEKEGTKEWRWRDVGMKIACGFEMLFQESKGRSDRFSTTLEGTKSSAEARKESLQNNPDYQKYVSNLVSAGYFKGELEGSQLWTSLEDKAASSFIDARREDDAARQSFATFVNNATMRADPNISLPDDPEDSDEWLMVNMNDLDTMLGNAFGSSANKAKEDSGKMDFGESPEDGAADQVAKEQASRLRNLAEKVANFVDGQGDLEGARFEDELSDDDPEFDNEFSDDNMTDSDNEVEADMKALADMEGRQAAMEKLVPALDASDYGKMPPSYYTNSQRVVPTTVETDTVPDKSVPPSEPPDKPVRGPLLPRDQYDGVDSDDETDEDDAAGDEEDEEEDKPQVIGEVEIDMEEEEEDFLEFSRQALGISDAQWKEILQDRKGRGAFVPTHVTLESKPSQDISLSEKLWNQDRERDSPPQTPRLGSRPNANPNLDSFEAVMEAMDAELSRSRRRTNVPLKLSKDKGKGKARADTIEEVEDIEAAMDAELKAALQRGDADYDEVDGEVPMDYNLIKNFLESFKGQGGLSGPVGNLAGRLQPDWKLPRDES